MHRTRRAARGVIAAAGFVHLLELRFATALGLGTAGLGLLPGRGWTCSVRRRSLRGICRFGICLSEFEYTDATLWIVIPSRFEAKEIQLRTLRFRQLFPLSNIFVLSQERLASQRHLAWVGQRIRSHLE